MSLWQEPVAIAEWQETEGVPAGPAARNEAGGIPPL